MRIDAISPLRTTFAVEPSRPLAKDRQDHGQAPFQPPLREETRTWASGEHLPPMYMQPAFRLAEPSLYDLAPEPYGYRYVRVRDHIYLAQLETGFIREVIPAPLP
jgi:Ni/Co efflux regulator RcnB